MLLLFARTLLLYLVVILAVRLMGKRQLGQLQTSELVVMLLISDLASIPMQNAAQPMTDGLVPIAVLVLCEIAASLLMLRFPRLRQAVCGRPTVVIARGIIQQDEMRALRMSVEELFEQLRQKGVKSPQQVAFAIVETNGLLSVIRFDAEDAATPRQLSLSVQEEGPAVVVVDDGHWRDHSLALCGKDRAWGEAILREQGLKVRDVFLMTADAQGNTSVVPRKKKEKPRRAGS